MLKDRGIISEVKCGSNFEYVLENSVHFVNTDYKVLQSQTNGIFVQCMKMLRNGKLALYYLTDDYRPINSMFASITPDMLILVVINLFADVIEVRNNGFLNCQNIDLSWDKVFVEQNTLKVKLVYIPVSERAIDSYAEYESELRSSIVKLIDLAVSVPSQRLNHFVHDLRNGSLSLEDVYNKSRSAGMPPLIEPPAADVMPGTEESSIRVVAMNAPGHFEILIDKGDMLLGKKRELVDAVIPFNKMISRKHCRISKSNGKFYISDEGSANGTYVNRVRLSTGQRQQIKKGDIIRLADSDFQIV